LRAIFLFAFKDMRHADTDVPILVDGIAMFVASIATYVDIATTLIDSAPVLV
jgi:hypothetical protein